ncbi:MAG: SusD/RagB family nutrient-binding outer membrane lipoprotein, partial [Prevotella sp.]
ISVVNRIPFDPQERIRNKTNYDKAVQMLGGADDYATKMWWQKK